MFQARDRQNILRERLRKFIGSKYDVMVRALQFGDNINHEFQSVETIVNFICDKMTDSEDRDSQFFFPELVKQKMANALKVRDGKPDKMF